jgi:hypothetical protein
MRKTSLMVLIVCCLVSIESLHGQTREELVRQSYHEALGRAPQAGEINHWVGRSDWRTKHDLVSFHRQFIRQNAQAARGVVVASYQAVFLRAPSEDEIRFWLPHVRQGMTCAELESRHRQFLANQAPKTPEPRRDPWIGQAFQEVLGRDPQGAEWDPVHYGQGRWSSYRDLVNKVRVKLTGQGVAYIFIKPEQAVYQGHIAWGFIRDDGRYVYGSTENPMKPMPQRGLPGDRAREAGRAVWDAITIPAGQDNGYWHGIADTEAEMLADMKRTGSSRQASERYPYGFRCSGYTHYKSTPVARRYALNAMNMAQHTRTSGYIGVGWNCLDQTYAILEAYGVDKNTVMPWKQTHPSPNHWFNHFGRHDPKSGQYHRGNNTAGSPL